MDKLSNRVMALEGPDREIFLAAYAACYPNGGTPWASDACHKERFELLVAKEAWLSAAEMLVPEGWGKTLTEPSDGPISEAPCSAMVFNLFVPEPNRFTSASTSLPLALCAAALKSRGL